MRIPKIIHYCWFGDGDKSELIHSCINSWEKFLPDYQLICWNESNFDVGVADFSQQAFEKKKWAFVSDYVRLYALEKYGGVYLDTDVEVISEFDHLFNDKSLILCSEDMGGIVTSFIASAPNHVFISNCLEIYNSRKFVFESGKLNNVPNNKVLKSVLVEYGFNCKNQKQELDKDIIVYPDDYFHVKSLVSGKLNLTDRSCMIHYHTLSWVSRKSKLVQWLRFNVFVPLLGTKNYYRLVSYIKSMAKIS